MSRTIAVLTYILLLYNSCIGNDQGASKGSDCLYSSDCLSSLNCYRGICEECLSENTGCLPEAVHLNQTCCPGLTCEFIEGMSNYMCRLNHNTCQIDRDCTFGSRLSRLKCLQWSNKCGICKDDGLVCTRHFKCCGFCDPVTVKCKDSPNSRGC
jgi:hypothetical protein